MKKIMILLAAILMLAFAGCKDEPAKSKSEKLIIAVIPKGTTHEFWKSIHAGAIKAAQEEGAEIIWKGPLREDDRQSQIDAVEDMINRNVAGIVLAPLDNTALRTPVVNAVRSNIPVVIIDSALDCNDYTSFVATDNYAAGKKAGTHLGQLLKGNGKVVMLRYAEGSTSTMERERGFLDSMKEFQGIQVVSSNQYGGATTETAYKASENMLASFKRPDGGIDIDGIFACNESTTFGMLRALQDGGLAGKVRFVGFDSSEKLVAALAAKQIDALILQNPMHMGYLGVKTLILHLKGQPVERLMDTGSSVVTLENMETPEIREILTPDLDRWLER
jgi:ribose transport system substrate-binding protein